MNMKKKVLIGALSLLVIGGTLAITGYFMGGKTSLGGFDRDIKSSGKMVHTKKNLNQFNNIEINMDAGEIKIEEGNKAEIEISYDSEYNTIEHKIENDKLIINGNIHSNKFNIGNHIDRNYVIIRMPKNTKINKAYFNIKAGEVQVNGLTVDTLETKVSAGEVSMDSVSVNNALINVTTGEAKLINFISNGLNSKVVTGSLEIEGKLMGKTDISIVTGEARINSNSNIKEYSYDFSTKIGEVEFNGQSETTGGFQKSGSFKNDIKAKVTTGTLEVNIK